MIIDHRTYTLKPGCLAEYLRLYETEGYAIQTGHLGQPVGWYTSMDIGELNQVVHLWGYDDLADRAKRRGAMAADPKWRDYAKKIHPHIVTQTTKILSQPAFIKTR
jgi:hypothetical protein